MLKPLAASRWNYERAAHLLNRAGFGGPPSEIQRLADLGPDGAVAYLVDYEKISDTTAAPEWAKPDPTRLEKFREIREFQRKYRDASEEEKKQLEQKRREFQREERRTQQRRLLELRQWWLGRMADGRRPLQEKLTLFWHGHFATSTQKVRDAYLMWRQNETFRQHASGNWLKMLTAVAQDPAMLIWLDQAQSRKEHPNENFAREVMELFALGEGHYTERDVVEAARAFTGWTLSRTTQQFEYRPTIHDNADKSVLGREGNLTGTEVLEQIAAQPQAAKFIVGKLWRFFVSDETPARLIDALAAEFRKFGDQFRPVLRLIFRSEEFYAPPVIRTQVKSPVQWLVSSVRMLERELPPPMITANALRLLGQELFAPPNVKGWDGGLSWITTNSLMNRYNLSAFLVLGENPFSLGGDRPQARMTRERLNEAGRAIRPMVVSAILKPEECRDKGALIRALEKRLLQARLRQKQERILRDYLEAQGELDDKDILHAIRLVMCTPEFQLT